MIQSSRINYSDSQSQIYSRAKAASNGASFGDLCARTAAQKGEDPSHQMAAVRVCNLTGILYIFDRYCVADNFTFGPEGPSEEEKRHLLSGRPVFVTDGEREWDGDALRAIIEKFLDVHGSLPGAFFTVNDNGSIDELART